MDSGPNLPPVLDYRGRTSERTPSAQWVKGIVPLLCLIQSTALLGAIAWALLFVGPALPKTIAFDVVPLRGTTSPAVVALSREHPFPSEHFSELVWLLGSAGGTILNGPGSAPAAAPERLDVRALYSEGGVTWVELPKGWIEVGRGMVAFWPNSGGWYLLRAYDARAASCERGWGGNMHDAQVFYTDLPEGFISASRTWAMAGGGMGTSLAYLSNLPKWQSLLWMRLAIIAVCLVGLWVNVAYAHKVSERRRRWLVAWIISLLAVALLGAWLVRPATEFFVVPGSKTPWLHWQAAMLVPCAIGMCALGVIGIGIAYQRLLGWRHASSL